VAIVSSADIAPRRRFVPRALRVVTIRLVLVFVMPFVLAFVLFVLFVRRIARWAGANRQRRSC
jgi:hypothetical protein